MTGPKRTLVMNAEEVAENADDISRRWQVVATLAGRLHIIDRDLSPAARAASNWKTRSLCGVSQASPRGDHPLRPTSRPLGEVLTAGEIPKPWCRQCVGIVRRAYRRYAPDDVVTLEPLAGASTKRVMLVGPINRSRDRGATYPGFREAAAYLRNQFIQVSDPSDMLRSLTVKDPYADHVRAHMEMFWDADGVVTMEGWEGSNMATLAVMTARVVQVPILELSRFGGITPAEHGKWQTWCDHLLCDEGEKAIW